MHASHFSWFTLISCTTHTHTHSTLTPSVTPLRSETKGETEQPVPSSPSPQWCCSPQGWGCLPERRAAPQTRLRLTARTFYYSSPWWCAFPSVCPSVCLPCLPACLSPCLPAFPGSLFLLLSLCIWCVLVCAARLCLRPGSRGSSSSTSKPYHEEGLTEQVEAR